MEKENEQNNTQPHKRAYSADDGRANEDRVNEEEPSRKLLKLEMIRFFDELRAEKIEATRERFAQETNELLEPIKKASLEKIKDQEAWDRMKRVFTLECGFWVSLYDRKGEDLCSSFMEDAAKLKELTGLTIEPRVIEFGTINPDVYIKAAIDGFSRDPEYVECSWWGLEFFNEKIFTTDNSKNSKVELFVGEYSKNKHGDPYRVEIVLSDMDEHSTALARRDGTKGKITTMPLCEALCPIESFESLLKQSMVGLGASTVFDPSVRLASEFAARSYCIPTRGMWYFFRETFKYFLRPCMIQFDKVAVYKTGDFFKPHRDTVRSPNHVATLLVGTDYEYTGGEFVVGEGKDAEEYTLTGDFAVLFYTDVLHSVKKIESGNRVVLQFKVLLAEDSDKPNLVYSPTAQGAEFYTRKEFEQLFGFSDPPSPDQEEADEDSSDDSSDEDSSNEDSSDSDNSVALFSADRANPNQVGLVTNGERGSACPVTLAEGFAKMIGDFGRAHEKTAFFLQHFYPQKHIKPEFLRGVDREIYSQLSAHPRILRLSLTPIRLRGAWEYRDKAEDYSAALYLPRMFYDEELACFQHKLFVHAYTEQSLNCIANLCSEASPYGNQGVDAKGEYWYSAGLCLVHFNDFKDD